METDRVIKTYTTRLTQSSSNAIEDLQYKISKQLEYKPSMNEAINFAVQISAKSGQFDEDEKKLFKIIK